MPAINKPSSSKKSDKSGTDLETWVEKIVDGKDGGSVVKQALIGGASGWLTGFLAMKVGKIAATAVGGGVIMLQIANHKGYINVNWDRLNRDGERVSDIIQKKAGKKTDWTDKLEKKLDRAADRTEQLFNRGERNARRWYHKLAYGEDLRVKELQVFCIAYAVGVALGLISGH